MLDIFNLINQPNSQTYYTKNGAWQTWQKPRNAKLIEIIAIGGGAAGAAVAATTTTTARGGGGGGGSGAIAKCIIPAFLLPDILYLSVGSGSKGTNLTAFAGVASYVSIDTTVNNQSLILQANGGNQGGSTSSTAGGTAGGGGAITTINLNAFSNLGLVNYVAGVNGSVGGSSTTDGLSQNVLTTNILTGGAGGAGKATSVFSGGSIGGSTYLLTSSVNGGAAGISGDNGYGSFKPLMGAGGAGGGSSNTGTPGSGGDAWFGCGGGGAGAGVNSAIGGDGGDGLIIITVL
jgi:hypothetical protein